MIRNQFKRYIESARDCDAALLDIAVNKGLLRAESEAPDFKKFINLAAMCVATTALCIAINLEPVRIGATDFLLTNSMVTQSGSEALHSYFSGITSAMTTYLGGN